MCMLICAIEILNIVIVVIDAIKAVLVHFFCQMYVPNTVIAKVKESRWWLFRKKTGKA